MNSKEIPVRDETTHPPGIDVPDGQSAFSAAQEVAPGLRLTKFREAKLVTKPWGWERWLHETGAPFGFKVIMIKAGHRTSLQYHERKQETYFILQGEGRLHYRQSVDAEGEVADFSSGAIGHVDPGTVHRVEAITDIILIESTTPDDGTDNVRIQDDLGRPSGRIEEEHDPQGAGQ
jgi:mannose-6-phosphate isomerase-like protein (cupin superfamily)